MNKLQLGNYIYGLAQDGEFFYVGSTVNLEKRKQLHINKAFGRGSHNKIKDNRIKQAVTEGTFSMIILSSLGDISTEELTYREYVWIDRFLTAGIELVNVQGTGPRLSLIDRDNCKILSTGRSRVAWSFESGRSKIACKVIKHKTGVDWLGQRHWLIPEVDIEKNGIEFYSKPMKYLINRKTDEVEGIGRTLKQITLNSRFNYGSIQAFNSKPNQTHYIETSPIGNNWNAS